MGIFSQGIFRLLREGISSKVPSNIVQVNERFGNLKELFVSDTHIRAVMTTFDSIYTTISSDSMVVIDANNSAGSHLEVTNNSTAIYRGNLSDITCGFDYSIIDSSGYDRSTCIINSGGIVENYFLLRAASIMVHPCIPQSALVLKNMTRIHAMKI